MTVAEETNDLFQNILDDSTIHFETNLDFEVAKLMKQSKLMLSVAESITGGMLSQRITTLPGSSSFFLGGIITYHNKLKITLGGVSPTTLKTKTAVSQDVALEMARGVKKITNSDLCISTTGVAGPADHTYSIDMTGTVFLGFVLEGNEKTKAFHFEGNRDLIRRQTTTAALMYLKQYLMNRQEGGL